MYERAIKDTLWVGREHILNWRLLENELEVESKCEHVSSLVWGEKKHLALKKVYTAVKASRGKEVEKPNVIKPQKKKSEIDWRIFVDYHDLATIAEVASRKSLASMAGSFSRIDQTLATATEQEGREAHLSGGENPKHGGRRKQLGSA